jgi:hypothetical protein
MSRRIIDEAKKFLEQKANPVEVISYDKKANPIDAENHGCVARITVHEKTGLEKCEVRVCTRGIDSGLFFNPLNHHHDDLVRFDSHTGKLRFCWREVSRTSFDQYVQFLKSGNQAMLRMAQRS